MPFILTARHRHPTAHECAAPRYFRKGSAKLCGLVEVVNSKYEREAEGEDEDDVEDRLVPRTEDLPLYTMAEFNEKVRKCGSIMKIGARKCTPVACMDHSLRTFCPTAFAGNVE